MSHQSIIYRKNRIPYLNLGIFGNWLAGEEIANYIVEIDPKMKALDYYWTNPSVQVSKDTLFRFID